MSVHSEHITLPKETILLNFLKGEFYTEMSAYIKLYKVSAARSSSPLEAGGCRLRWQVTKHTWICTAPTWVALLVMHQVLYRKNNVWNKKNNISFSAASVLIFFKSVIYCRWCILSMMTMTFILPPLSVLRKTSFPVFRFQSTIKSLSPCLVEVDPCLSKKMCPAISGLFVPRVNMLATH